MVIGPALLQAWRLAPWYGVALVASFYMTMIVSTAFLLLAFAAARVRASHGYAFAARFGRAVSSSRSTRRIVFSIGSRCALVYSLSAALISAW